MVGHIYANWLIANSKGQVEKEKLYSTSHKQSAEIEFPALALVVSGGHTDLLIIKDHGDYKLLGGTRDDAAGEAFDKIGRMLGLSYPAGPEIEKAALKGDPVRFRFPRPLIGSSDYDFSFSGLKTAVLREVISLRHPEQSEGSQSKVTVDSSTSSQNDIHLDKQTINDLAFATQDAIIDVLAKKTLKAAFEYNAKSILISGGVAANQKLRETLLQMTKDQRPKTNLFAPPKSLCTDNAAMIASAGYFNFSPVSWQKITADPELYFT